MIVMILSNVNWTLIGKVGSDTYEVPNAVATIIPGVFVADNMPVREFNLINHGHLNPVAKHLVKLGVIGSEMSGNAIVITDVVVDQGALQFHEISDGFGFGGVFFIGMEHSPDEYHIVNKKEVVHGNDIEDDV
ncbi:hypothetical protein SEA_LITTLEFELLA_39 [Gordonia phage LittleFella]|nr:hypothetical protein SEA_LITTLEFELLA_39 [Gordonia phage LittleFella]